MKNNSRKFLKVSLLVFAVLLFVVFYFLFNSGIKNNFSYVIRPKDSICMVFMENHGSGEYLGMYSMSCNNLGNNINFQEILSEADVTMPLPNKTLANEELWQDILAWRKETFKKHGITLHDSETSLPCYIVHLKKYDDEGNKKIEVSRSWFCNSNAGPETFIVDNQGEIIKL